MLCCAKAWTGSLCWRKDHNLRGGYPGGWNSPDERHSIVRSQGADMPKTTIELTPVKLSGKPALRTKRVRQPNGKMISVHSLEASSATLAADLRALFIKNVATARRANAALPTKVLNGLAKVATSKTSRSAKSSAKLGSAKKTKKRSSK
jgi:hypothetical protein